MKVNTQWWNSGAGKASHIDFTKPEAAEWYSNRLKNVQQVGGIDSFKFDAGETSWAPKDPILNATIDEHPSALTKAYVRTVSKFGSIIETRTAQGTQDVPIFVRMLDKDSEWTFANGLPTLITTLLQMNLVGYPFILPDMIGGNGYNGRLPSKELFIRWLQANTFMPSLQYSYVPWDYDAEVIAISRKYTELHTRAAPIIIQGMKRAVTNGESLNLPIWWVDPNDKIAQQIDDGTPHISNKFQKIFLFFNLFLIFVEYLLTSDVLVAPVIKEGATARDIYLPRGRWIDANSMKVIEGPKWLMNYASPLNILPFFVREGAKNVEKLLK